MQYALHGDADTRPSLLSLWSRLGRKGTPAALGAADAATSDYLAAHKAMEYDMIRRAMAASAKIAGKSGPVDAAQPKSSSATAAAESEVGVRFHA